jgi:hypothetical protein
MRSFTIPLTLVAALGAGCVDDSSDGGIFISKAVAPSDSCSFSSTAAEPFLPHGVWSVHSTGGYQLFPQMTSRITADDTQVDQRTIILQGARVDIEITDDELAGELDLQALQDAGITKFQSRFTAPLSPNGGITDGAVELITPELIDAIAAVRPDLRSTAEDRPVFRTELLASIVVFGDMTGDEVTSQKFTFPVTLCNDCVVNILGACPLPADSAPRTGNACNPYQDGSLDCCVEADGALTCPARVATPTTP